MYFIRDVQCIDGIAVNSQFAIGKIHADITNELVAFHDNGAGHPIYSRKA